MTRSFNYSNKFNFFLPPIWFYANILLSGIHRIKNPTGNKQSFLLFFLLPFLPLFSPPPHPLEKKGQKVRRKKKNYYSDGGIKMQKKKKIFCFFFVRVYPYRILFSPFPAFPLLFFSNLLIPYEIQSRRFIRRRIK